MLERHRQPRALFTALADDPGRFVDLVKRVYRGRGEPKRQLDEREEAMARHAWHILHEWSVLPGQRDDGSLDGEHLARWVREARLELAACAREDVGDEAIGQILACSPPGADGAWPAEPVRDILEQVASPELDMGLYSGRLNRRGVTTRGPLDGGGQERDLEGLYREWGKQTAGTYPRTSRLLRRLVDHFEHYARHMDEEAEGWSLG
jgi:hypothetical protein